LAARRVLTAEVVDAGAKADAEATHKENKPTETLILTLLFFVNADYATRYYMKRTGFRKQELQQVGGNVN
jgi:ABC-type nitrate/sulfonate/bicarbonate transport system substrate-binding protein